MSTLYIRLPSKFAADAAAAHWLELLCPFVLVSHSGSIEREGATPLSELSDTIAKAQRVVVLLAASDVALLQVQAPPLSAAKLKAALPGLVEEQLLVDPSGCELVAGDLSDGLRTIAVVQRSWLELLARTLIAFGARRISAVPIQLCLPCADNSEPPGGVAAAADGQVGVIDVALRLSAQDGVGLAVSPDESQDTEREGQASAQAVLQALRAVAPPGAPITLYVPQPMLEAYREAIGHAAGEARRIDVVADNWQHWLAGVQGATLDLMAGLGVRTGHKLDWRAWRWPLALAGSILLINAIALNLEWWRVKKEADSLRAGMIQIYKSAYPQETTILDPVAQIQQKIALAKRDSGLPAPDDFTAMSAALGEAWARVMPGAASAIASLEYRERSLVVRFKPGVEMPPEQIAMVLAERGLSLDAGSPDPASGRSAAVWQIRSAR